MQTETAARSTYTVIDSHVHIYSTQARCESLNWLHADHALNHPHSFADYQESNPATQSAVFVECDTNSAGGLGPLFNEFKDAAAQQGIRAIVAWAPMDSKKRLMEYLADIELIDERQLLRGIRVLLQDKPNGYCLVPAFLECIAHLGTVGLLFEIGIDVHRRGVVQLQDALAMIEQSSGTNFVIDHLAKPDVSTCISKDYHDLMTRISSFRNVSIKLSGGFTELESGDSVPHKNLASFIHLIVHLFGAERVLFGSDWPVLTMSKANVNKTPLGWLMYCQSTLKDMGLTCQEMQNIFEANARRIYRMP